jgi:CP family cyanate transporter-like MFS transporter
MGVLHDATGSWTVPIIAVATILVPQLVTGVLVCRPQYVDDELATR